MNLKTWAIAFRLRTLPLALSCIAMGSFLAASKGSFDGLIFTLCISTSIFLQILSNLANDYGDTISGVDSIERQGPIRTVQDGTISLMVMKKAIGIFITLSFISGIALLYVAFGWHDNTWLFFLGLGLLSIAAAITYTMGHKPYGYVGLGDLSVLLFFGLVGVMGSSYLYIQLIEWSFILPAMSCGLFSVAVLNINNIRDIKSDKKTGKYSIPVRLGRDKAVIYHWILILAGIGTSIVFTIYYGHNYSQWLFLLVVPFLINNVKGVSKNKDTIAIDPYLKQMALITSCFVLLFGIGLLI